MRWGTSNNAGSPVRDRHFSLDYLLHDRQVQPRRSLASTALLVALTGACTGPSAVPVTHDAHSPRPQSINSPGFPAFGSSGPRIALPHRDPKVNRAEPCSRMPLPGYTYRRYRVTTCWILYYEWRTGGHDRSVAYTLLTGLKPRTSNTGILLYSSVNNPLAIVRTPLAGRQPRIISVRPPHVQIAYTGTSATSDFDLATGRFERG